MVSFSSLFTSAVAIMAVPVMSALTPQQTIDGLKGLTTKSKNLQGPAKSISLTNAPLILIGQGPFPKIISGLQDFIQTGTNMMVQSQGSLPTTGTADAEAVYNAYLDFTRDHGAFLKIMISKAGTLEQLPFIGGPVAAALRQSEAVVDTLSFHLINNVESKSKDLTNEANKLSDIMTMAIKAYDGLLGKREAKVFVA